MTPTISNTGFSHRATRRALSRSNENLMRWPIGSSSPKKLAAPRLVDRPRRAASRSRRHSTAFGRESVAAPASESTLRCTTGRARDVFPSAACRGCRRRCGYRRRAAASTSRSPRPRPGSACSRGSRASKKRCLASAGRGLPARKRQPRAEDVLRVQPEIGALQVDEVRISSPAPASSTSDSATSTTTNEFRSQPRRNPPADAFTRTLRSARPCRVWRSGRPAPVRRSAR